MQHPLWHKIPLVRLLVPFVCGIGFSMYTTCSLHLVGACFAVLFAASVWVHLSFKQYEYRWVFGVFISCCACAAGWTLHLFLNEFNVKDHYHTFDHTRYVAVMITAEPAEKPTVWKLSATAVAVVDSAGVTTSATGKLLLYVAKQPGSQPPVYGDLLLVPASAITPVKPPANPDEFDFKQYLARKQIFYQGYVPASQLLVTGENRGNFVFRSVYAVQRYMKHVLAVNIGSQNETGVAEALLYGYDKDIDDETKQAYSNTGTLHVLAVSGMHVGIIYMVLGLLLAPLHKVRKGKVLSQLIILVCLWAYSFICGLSPSILRATVMFSFIIAAGLMKQQSVVYNTLAASVIVLLCWDANLITNVGFQLSYLAVLGILFFQSYISAWYTAPNWLLHQIWLVTAVSLAAQLITFPIGLLYFHQFPNCFLLSNLLMIPLTTLILYAGMVLLSVAWFPWLAAILGKVVYYLILFTNEVVKWIEQLPYAYVNGIRINVLQSILLYAIIVLLTFFFIRREKLWFKLALICTCCFCVLVVYTDISTQTQSKLIVYAVPKYNAIQWIRGNKALLITDSAFAANTGKIKFHLQPHIWKSGITDQQIVYTNPVQWQKINMEHKQVLITGTEKPPQDSCDILIVTSKQDPSELFEAVRPGQVILTSAVKPADAAHMMETARRQKIDVKYVGDTGAIELSLLSK